MKTLYLECSLGVSGDMLLAALSDLLPQGRQLLEDAVAALGLPGVSLRFTEQMVQGIRTRRVAVLEEAAQPLRHLKDLTDIIAAAPTNLWPEAAKAQGLAALTSLAEAESRVHGEPLEQIHFHEVGAVDTVVDILGAVLLAQATGAQQILASAVNLGSGFVTFSHGRFPVPAPASAELARGMRTFATDSGLELATPTGLCLVKTLAQGYGTQPLGSIEAVGYGSGTYSTGAYPTFLRAFLLRTDAKTGAKPGAKTGDRDQDHEDYGSVYYGPHGHDGSNHGQGRHIHAKEGFEHGQDDAGGHAGHRHQGRHGHQHHGDDRD